jgi:hypothetical protein
MKRDRFRSKCGCAAFLFGCAFGFARSATAADAPSPSGFDEPAPKPPSRLGLMFDVGSMEGGLLSLVYRVSPELRLEGGAGTNSVSPGFRLGVVALPWHSATSSWPTFSLAGGHFFEGDINGVVRLFASGYRYDTRLEHFDYDFVSLHVGWEAECGSLLFFAQGGASVLWSQIPAAAAAMPLAAAAPSAVGEEPFWLVLPSLRLGFVGFL